MWIGLPVSFLLHAGILTLALISFARSTPRKPPEPEPVQVSVITSDDLVRLTQGDRNAKQLDGAPAPPAPDSKAIKEPPKPKIVTPPPPPPPVEAKAEPPPPPVKEPEPPKPDPIAEKLAMLPPDPVPGPDPAELKRQEDEARRVEEQRRAQEQKRIEEQKKKAEAERKKRLADLKKREDAKKLAEAKKKAEEAKKKSFDDIMAEAINPALKDNDPRKKPPPPGGAQTAQASAKKGPAAGAPEGRDTQLTASQGAMLGAMIKQAVSKCWNINTGAEGIDKIVVRLEVRLRPDGRLVEPPRVRDPMPGALFSDTANSAIRAVHQCEPYNFPPELYKGGWDASIWTFDPRRMF